MLTSVTAAAPRVLWDAPCLRAEQIFWQAIRFKGIMTEGKDEDLEEAKELFKEGVRRILQATKKVSEKVVEGFREGYAQDVTKKEE